MDFQAGLEKAISALVEGALDISRKLLAGELEWRTKKAKAKATKRKQAIAKVRKKLKKARTKLPKMVPAPTTKQAIASRASDSPTVGSKWRRRDGDEAKTVLAIDDAYVTVSSDRFAQGTLVKRRQFFSRYKPWEGK